MRTAHNKTTPTNLYFLAEFHKKGPAGSEKQVINLVWPYNCTLYPTYDVDQRYTARAIYVMLPCD